MIVTKELIEYAPMIIVVVAFLFKNKIFVTPMQLEIMRAKIKEEAEAKFVTLFAYKEYRYGNEKKMDELIQGINDIKEFLMKKNERTKR